MFEHLDDANPPQPGIDRRQAVTDEITRHRRRRVQRAIVAAAAAAVLVAVGGVWAFAGRTDTSVVDTMQSDQSWPAFCAAAARIRDDQQHVQTTGGTVVYPNLDTDYAALTVAAPDPSVRQALGDAQAFLFAPVGYPYTPVQLHAARVVEEALVSRCDSSTAIFGLVVGRIDVTLPAYQARAETTLSGAVTGALVGLDEAEAARAAEGSGWTLRVVSRDGVGQMVLGDLESNRLDLTVADGIVTAVATE